MTGKSDYMAMLHRETREELTRVDGKIGIFFRAYLVTIGLVAAGITASAWNPLDLTGFGEVLWWVGVGLAVSAVAALLIALSPTTIHSKPPTGGPRYFADVARYATSDELKNAVAASSSADRLADQTLELARIIVRKYDRVRLANWLYPLGVLAAATGSLTG